MINNDILAAASNPASNFISVGECLAALDPDSPLLLEHCAFIAREIAKLAEVADRASDRFFYDRAEKLLTGLLIGEAYAAQAEQRKSTLEPVIGALGADYQTGLLPEIKKTLAVLERAGEFPFRRVAGRYLRPFTVRNRETLSVARTARSAVALYLQREHKGGR
jgi:hypothetical protein